MKSTANLGANSTNLFLTEPLPQQRVLSGSSRWSQTDLQALLSLNRVESRHAHPSHCAAHAPVAIAKKTTTKKSFDNDFFILHLPEFE